MKLTRGRKIALGIATAWPPFYIVCFLIAALSMMAVVRGGGTALPSGMQTAIFVGIALHLFTIVLGLVLLVLYGVHALQNEELDRNSRGIWTVLFIFGSFVAMSIYFCKHVLPLRDDTA